MNARDAVRGNHSLLRVERAHVHRMAVQRLVHGVLVWGRPVSSEPRAGIEAAHPSPRNTGDVLERFRVSNSIRRQSGSLS
jgi:hypothetical protein